MRASRYTPIELAADERKRVYGASRRFKFEPKCRNALRGKREQRQFTLRKWEEQLTLTPKGEWTRLLVCDLEAWLELSLIHISEPTRPY